MLSNNRRTFYNYLKRSARLSPFSRSRNRLCRRTATSAHFWSTHGNNAQDWLWKYWIQRSPQDSKPSANNDTCYSLTKSITGHIKFTKRVEAWINFWQLDDVFEPPVQNELIVWKTDSPFRGAGTGLARFARVRLSLYSKPILGKNLTVLQSKVCYTALPRASWWTS